jgi:hypothetical protein
VRREQADGGVRPTKALTKASSIRPQSRPNAK